MRKRNQMKKGIAALLSSVLAFGMTAGVIPEFGDSMRSVRAATGKPSVTAYATKQTSLDKGTQRKTTENELPSLTQCTA